MNWLSWVTMDRAVTFLKAAFWGAALALGATALVSMAAWIAFGLGPEEQPAEARLIAFFLAWVYGTTRLLLLHGAAQAEAAQPEAFETKTVSTVVVIIRDDRVINVATTDASARECLDRWRMVIEGNGCVKEEVH